MADRRRNLFILLLVAGLIAASIAVASTKSTKLGLDLQGGVQLVYEGKPTPQVPNVTQDALQRALDIMRDRVDALGVAEPALLLSGRNQIEVDLPGVPNADRAQAQVGNTAQMYFYDWEPNVLAADCKPDQDNEELTTTPLSSLKEAVQRASKCRPQLDDNNTVKDTTYYLFAKDGSRVGVPGESREDVLADKEGQQALENGGEVLTVPEGVKVVRAELPDNLPKGQPKPDRWFVIQDNPELSGTDIKNPEQNYDQRTNEPIVTMDFTSKGRKAFQEVTRRIAQRGQESSLPGQTPRFGTFAIVLDDEIVSRPYINFRENPDGIDGSTGAQISGGFTIQSAQDLAKFLKIGALPVKLKLISKSNVSASLGKQALDEGLKAGIVGFVVVALFLLLVYRVLGLIAVVALGIYALYFFALIKLIPITMTLPGIAGMILTIGVAADANIVIFERIKEEVRGGRSIAAAIAQGYKKGFATILDANVVTLLTAFILFILATAGVKGFAFTLGVGTLVSLFTAVLATHALLLTMRGSRALQAPSALGAGGERRGWRFDYMGNSKWFFSMSGAILMIGALAIAVNGLNLGIDFESGTRARVALQRPATVEQVRDALGSTGGTAKIQTVQDPDIGQHVVQVSVKKLPPEQVNGRIRAPLEQRFGIAPGDQSFIQESIGPTFGESVAQAAIYAIIASLLVICAYIALRFEWKFAVPVLIALMHDILITSGVYALTDREVTASTVAALLTILGFSLYDTIIVFDRIRENVPRMPNATFAQIVNRSMSEVIVRSLATSFCTVLPVIALFAFGGETLKDFAFALIIGTVSGAYSSIFIAAPVLTHWKQREAMYLARERRVREASGGLVPAYAVAMAGAPVDVAPSESRRRRARGQDPTQGVSREEFDEMVRDLHVDQPRAKTTTPGGPAPRPGGRRAARRAAGGAAPKPGQPKPPDAGDGRPERKESAAAKQRKKHGRPR